MYYEKLKFHFLLVVLMYDAKDKKISSTAQSHFSFIFLVSVVLRIV